MNSMSPVHSDANPSQVIPSESHFNRLLPMEIKQEIFKLVCIDKKKTDHIALSIVCHEWYNVIRRTPDLWSTFNHEVNNTIPMELFKNWLSNHIRMSKNLPLSIRLDIPFPTQSGDKESTSLHSELLPVFEQLETVTDRLEHLDVVFCDNTMISAFEKVLEMDLPIVEKLQIFYWFRRRRTSNGIMDIATKFGDCPKLQNLALEYVPSLFGDEGYTKFKNLTSLRLGEVPFEHCLRSLELLPYLTAFDCGFIPHDTYPSERAGIAVVTHSSLTHLTVTDTKRGPRAHAEACFLEHVRCPSLRKLVILSRYLSDDNLGPSLYNFLTDSNCILEEMHPRNVTMNGYQWRIWKLQSNIKVLKLCGDFGIDESLNCYNRFLETLGSALFLPRLKELSIKPPVTEYLNDRTVLEALKTRRDLSISESVFELKIFEVHLLHDYNPDMCVVDKDVEDGFAELKREGMSISLVHDHW